MAIEMNRDLFNGNAFGLKICEVILPAITGEWENTVNNGGDGDMFLEGVLESLSQFLWEAFDMEDEDFEEDEDDHPEDDGTPIDDDEEPNEG